MAGTHPFYVFVQETVMATSRKEGETPGKRSIRRPWSRWQLTHSALKRYQKRAEMGGNPASRER